MNMLMDDKYLSTVEQIKRFLSGSEPINFVSRGRKECYAWLEKTLIKVRYLVLGKPDKGTVYQYLTKMTGYSRQQITRLIKQYVTKGVVKLPEYRRYQFRFVYTADDITLLAITDRLHGTLSGPATKKILEREFKIYHHLEYKNIARISVSHIYNLRGSKTYGRHHTHYTKTNPRPSVIGERAKPRPSGKPGYIRIDTVHQGDLNGTKGVYHVNAVDEITQIEVIVTVERIDEAHMLIALQQIWQLFPFKILGFHSDNGSEYVNHQVAAFLNQHLSRFTKSRSRHSNDNALVESKNGAIVRKHHGYVHIPQKHADVINIFNRDFLNPYINFHRPCFFPRIITDAKGKQRRIYKYGDMMTPYEKLKSLPRAKAYLKPGITFDQLNQVAATMSDNQFAERVVNARRDLDKRIR